MSRSRDPIEARHEGDVDLYEVASWEPRSAVDRLSTAVYWLLVNGGRALVVVFAVAILLLQVVLGGFGVIYSNPLLGGFVLLSVVPALALAAYVWQADVTTNEPLELLVATFLLGVLFAGFAGVVNTVFGAGFDAVGSLLGPLAFLAQIPFYFLVVGPVEETVKLLAVRLYAYTSGEFDAVVDGAVYGAVAGLGFATIENALYIARTVDSVSDPENVVLQGGAIATVRLLAGPGHVIYSAFAGYYLGLAKFNRESAGPIVVKGLLIAALIHATYNSLAGVVPALVSGLWGVPWLLAFLAFVVVYDGILLFVLVRKLRRYRDAYEAVHAGADGEGPAAVVTEFDPPTDPSGD